jgi:hypothetical protein
MSRANARPEGSRTGWLCDTWARCPCYDKATSETLCQSRIHNPIVDPSRSRSKEESWGQTWGCSRHSVDPVGRASPLATPVVRLRTTSPTTVISQNRRAGTLALQKPHRLPPYSDHTRPGGRSQAVWNSYSAILRRMPCPRASTRMNLTMSLRGAQRRSNLNPWHGKLLRFARNDMKGVFVTPLFC